MIARTDTFSRDEHRRISTEWRAVSNSIPIHRVRDLMQRLAGSTDPEHIAVVAGWREGKLALTAISDDDAMTFMPRNRSEHQEVTS